MDREISDILIEKVHQYLQNDMNNSEKNEFENHIDSDLYQLFLRGRVWQKYASRFLRAEQLDVEEYEAYV